MNVDLGGPGALCSSHRMRLFLLGELPAREMEQMRQHAASCERCEAVRRETERERADLEAAMPFEALAAGVAERLARVGNPAPRGQRRQRWAKVAAIAGARPVPNTNRKSSGWPSDVMMRTRSLLKRRTSRYQIV